MKLYVTSDIHLEFGDLDLENRDNVDVLILGGDICVVRDLNRKDSRDQSQDSANSKLIKRFFQRVSERFPHVIMILGNHEHYHGDFAHSRKTLQNWFDQAGLDNIYLLEKDCKEIDDYLFIGGTLWTDFNRSDPLTLQHAKFAMTDFKLTRNSGVHFYKFIPEHALEDHMRMKNYIATVIDNRRAQGERSDRVIVVGHHSPSLQSIHEKYKHDYYLNGCFSSDMDEFIQDRPEIVLWTHGHTHEDFDYTVGNTRIVCNPRGYYGHESRVYAWQPKLVEL